MKEFEAGNKTWMEDKITDSGVDARYQHVGGLAASELNAGAAGDSCRVKRVSRC
ncbi:hypothetical protein PAT3040_01558 [Paenibacillus agaridevorans]|uniref:Uncharacterized protein n=1 Tax=Paenibacillus agaridevorans TaxID=171404 RepID=A0A2R5EK48_9BACL|nr:hypothetical protein PAT3040_01558 [Paenibacillus agaridevorans]